MKKEDLFVEVVDDRVLSSLDFIVTAGTVYEIARDHHAGDPYLVEMDDIPDDYRERWGMDE